MHEHQGFLDKLVLKNKLHQNDDLIDLLHQVTKCRIYVLYHNHCTDGMASAFTAWKRFGEDAEYLPVNYNESLPDMVLDQNTEIYILDFCISYDDLVALKSKVRLVQIIDHHEEMDDQFVAELCIHYSSVVMKRYFKCDSGFVMLTTVVMYLVQRFPWLFDRLCRYMDIDPPIFDTTKSGALLSWEYFHPIHPVPDIIRFVSDRDLWQFKYPDTKAAIEGLKQSGRFQDFEYWDSLAHDHEALEDCIAKGQVILDYNKANYKKFISSRESFKLINFDELVGAVYNTTSNVNELAEEFYLNDQFHVDFTLSYYIRGDGRIKMSFRSRNPGGADVRVQAKRWGGGGHEHASAAQLSTEDSLEFMKFLQTAEALPLEP